jgi:hypothetical protein
VRPLEQEARVSSSEKSSTPSSEKTSTPSAGPKRRGRGSFLYDKSVLYSDHCASERDLDDKGSDPRSGSKDHADEQENRTGNFFIQDDYLICLLSLFMARKSFS